MAWISALGLYKWDMSLFDLLQIPTGVDKETLIENLLTETAELEILYTNSDFMKMLIGIWSKKELARWEQLYNTTQLEYNPLESMTRVETWTDSGNATSRVAGYNESELVKAGDGSTEALHSGTIHGNIGNITQQQLVMEERKVADFNIYDVIIQDFKKRFCVQVY